MCGVVGRNVEVPPSGFEQEEVEEHGVPVVLVGRDVIAAFGWGAILDADVGSGDVLSVGDTVVNVAASVESGGLVLCGGDGSLGSFDEQSILS